MKKCVITSDNQNFHARKRKRTIRHRCKQQTWTAYLQERHPHGWWLREKNRLTKIITQEKVSHPSQTHLLSQPCSKMWKNINAKSERDIHIHHVKSCIMTYGYGLKSSGKGQLYRSAEFFTSNTQTAPIFMIQSGRKWFYGEK